MDLSEATPARGSGEDTRRSPPYRYDRRPDENEPHEHAETKRQPMSDSTSNAASTAEPHQVETATVGEGEGDTGAFAFRGGERS